MRNTHNDPIRDQVLIDYLPLVVFEARRMSERLPPMVDVDDLISCGTIGLMDALRRFDPSRGVKFRTYAVHRVRGAMLDFLRENDIYSRNVREFVRKMNQTIEKFTNEKGCPPSFKELAFLLDLAPDDLGKKLATIPVGPTLELTCVNGHEVSPIDELKVSTGEDVFDVEERRTALIEIINSSLTEREKFVLQFYYWEEMGLREIAIILAITESRVSQILTQAKKKMLVELRNNEIFSGAA
jgi:RNA polymerase sigma factor for flagellar operon FliA